MLDIGGSGELRLYGASLEDAALLVADGKVLFNRRVRNVNEVVVKERADCVSIGCGIGSVIFIR